MKENLTSQQLGKILFDFIKNDLTELHTQPLSKRAVANQKKGTWFPSVPKSYGVSRQTIFSLRNGKASLSTMRDIAARFGFGITAAYAIQDLSDASPSIKN